jgi:hypothetical protein
VVAVIDRDLSAKISDLTSLLKGLESPDVGTVVTVVSLSVGGLPGSGPVSGIQTSHEDHAIVTSLLSERNVGDGLFNFNRKVGKEASKNRLILGVVNVVSKRMNIFSRDFHTGGDVLKDPGNVRPLVVLVTIIPPVVAPLLVLAELSTDSLGELVEEGVKRPQKWGEIGSDEVVEDHKQIVGEKISTGGGGRRGQEAFIRLLHVLRSKRARSGREGGNESGILLHGFDHLVSDKVGEGGAVTSRTALHGNAEFGELGTRRGKMALEVGDVENHKRNHDPSQEGVGGALGGGGGSHSSGLGKRREGDIVP